MIQSRFSTTFFTAIGFSAATFSSATFAEASCDATMMQGSIAQLSATHATVSTSILIKASPTDVWATLTDFQNMSNWSTGTLQNMTGDIQNGGQVEIIFLFGMDNDGNPIANKIPHTLVFEEGASIGWSDPFPADIGGGRDNHMYLVQPCGDVTLFLQTDEITGNPYAANFAKQLMPLYQIFNADLKAEVEKE